jgi:hypothetical protein
MPTALSYYVAGEGRTQDFRRDAWGFFWKLEESQSVITNPNLEQ